MLHAHTSAMVWCGCGICCERACVAFISHNILTRVSLCVCVCARSFCARSMLMRWVILWMALCAIGMTWVSRRVHVSCGHVSASLCAWKCCALCVCVYVCDIIVAIIIIINAYPVGGSGLGQLNLPWRVSLVPCAPWHGLFNAHYFVNWAGQSLTHLDANARRT